jgi:outer membrane protein OmpA-like peptidoglycan-associated protein/tetratricopeptide (TPR) repeat protein
MIKNYFSFVLITLTMTPLFAQVEDESCLPPAKKVLKLIETGKNTADAKTAVLSFNEAIAAAPDNAMAYYEYGMFAYKQGMKFYDQNPNPSVGDKSMAKADEMFKQALTYCSDYHANCSYYIGVIQYSKGNKTEAIEYFKKFAAFKSDDQGRYPEDFSKKLADVQSVLKELEGEQELLTKAVPFNPIMVANVSSSSWDEYFPMISPDNELMFYTRKIDRKNKGDVISNVVEEFTYSSRTKSEGPNFDGGKPFENPFNDGTYPSYGAATMSVDNKEMILCACKDEMVDAQKYRNCDLYITRFERSGEGGNDFKWTPLENMGPGINSARGWDAQPTLSADGNTLYYTTLRSGADATQDNDIWVAERDSKGKWGAGRPFAEINTPGKDKSPFLHQDSETLYFVSSSTETRKGVGGLDIFYIRKEDGKWSKPKNIGYPINTAEDEIGIFVSTDGNLAYYSSRYGGNWNIYAFELYKEARPQAVAIVKGSLKDENGEPVKNATIEIAYGNSDKVETVKVNGDDGKYAAVVKTNVAQDVMVTVKKEGHAFDSKLITKEEIKKTTTIKGNDLAVRELKEGAAYTINDILFATNSYALTPKSEFILKQFARFLKENPTITIMVQGHTDDIGDDTQNMNLSKERANEVKKFLEKQGIQGTRMTSQGFGETKPKVPNKDESSRAINRRTDFMIMKL